MAHRSRRTATAVVVLERNVGRLGCRRNVPTSVAGVLLSGRVGSVPRRAVRPMVLNARFGTAVAVAMIRTATGARHPIACPARPSPSAATLSRPHAGAPRW
jgi:hypothetical protein